MTLFTLVNNANAHPEASVLKPITDLVAYGGVVDLVGGHFAVSQQASPNMTVKVAQGSAFLKLTNGSARPIYSDVNPTGNVTITANGSGNPRVDAVVLYANMSLTPSADGSGVGVLAAITGTPGASPVAPTDTDIANAIGVNNPFIRLANVTVASGAASIVDANIADARSQWGQFGGVLQFRGQSTTPSTPASGYGKLYQKAANDAFYMLDDQGQERMFGEENPVVITPGANITIDCSLGKVYSITLNQNTVAALSNAATNKRILVKVGQNGTGGYTWTWFNKATTFATSDVNTGTDVITVGRNIPTGMPIKFSSSGAVPTGLTAATKYYAINVSATTIKVASSQANAYTGTQIDITATGSGTHTITTEIAWPGDTEPTVNTGKYQSDVYGILISDAVNGIYQGFLLGSGFPIV